MSMGLKETYDGTLEALVAALDARDRDTGGHSSRVTEYTLDIARRLGLRQGSVWEDLKGLPFCTTWARSGFPTSSFTSLALLRLRSGRRCGVILSSATRC